MRTVLMGNIALNKSSSLTREWISIAHLMFPVKLIGAVGITTKYEPGEGYGGGKYVYGAEFQTS